MDLCDIGLFDIIKQKKSLSESEAKVIMSQLLKVLNHCHQKRIVHRDIKAQNIMIVLLNNKNEEDTYNENNWHIKLIDWGIAYKMKEGEKLQLKCGSPYYMSPDVIQGLYDSKCDVWSCGVLLYFMLTGRYPFFGSSIEELFRNITRGTIELDHNYWSRYSQECVSFLK